MYTMEDQFITYISMHNKYGCSRVYKYHSYVSVESANISVTLQGELGMILKVDGDGQGRGVKTQKP